ncbi:MAG: Rrf2 family transcriptional regulator [Christensenellaceae bacterium]|nr:Rrf2 family transcriptional regulator [Christensenellaceae bacterium]
MKLSTKGRYGVRAMYELALRFGSGPLSVKEIAGRQGVPEAYLEQLIAPLRRAGLVKSIRGAQGGYELAKPPNEISAYAVITALEGPTAPASCVLDEEQCENATNCAMHSLWQRIHDGVNDVLISITLQDLLTEPSPAVLCGEEAQKLSV